MDDSRLPAVEEYGGVGDQGVRSGRDHGGRVGVTFERQRTDEGDRVGIAAEALCSLSRSRLGEPAYVQTSNRKI